LAHLQLQQGKGEEAVALLRGLLKSGQADSTVKLVLSEVLINQNNKAAMDEAVKILIELCQVNPEVSEAWALYATAARAMGDFQTSEKLLQFALILEPDRPDFLMSLTQVLASRAAQDKNLLNKAEECAARTVALIPQDWRPALLHVHILRMGSRLVDAWGVLENAAQSFPTQSEVLVEQATLQSEVGRFNEARYFGGKDNLSRPWSLLREQSHKKRRVAPVYPFLSKQGS
jgi:cytochrome c-type biogenesis protein CcmH/NrfG